ncbi:TetR/AcrR family transcriptional regulator C-terminal domain-containing protein [Rhodococcus sp. NPDC058514]|uniref:TetR/AcrR family transcriptional regulator C-terminal domain-containing protein n=1 Tax=unclassified Rhodococcus (in: high G+C Gram-positive bacteria) TaxID=192944 RepID=UPI003653DB96
MSVVAGQGDAARSMALLWRAPGAGGTRSAPGPRPALTVDEIVAAAIAVADEAGMAGLSMRAVGARLDRTAMALYTYVPSKGELVDLMYDRAHGELPTHYDLTEGWRPAVTSWARDLWAFYVRHPWTLSVSYARPVLGPDEQAVLEALVRILFEAGLSARVLRRVVGALFHFVRGAAATVADSQRAAVATGMSDEQWWSTRSALLQQVAPDFAERFPMLVRLGVEAAAEERAFLEGGRAPHLEDEATENFSVGLDVLLDGIELSRSVQGAVASGRTA